MVILILKIVGFVLLGILCLLFILLNYLLFALFGYQIRTEVGEHTSVLVSAYDSLRFAGVRLLWADGKKTLTFCFLWGLIKKSKVFGGEEEALENFDDEAFPEDDEDYPAVSEANADVKKTEGEASEEDKTASMDATAEDNTEAELASDKDAGSKETLEEECTASEEESEEKSAGSEAGSEKGITPKDTSAEETSFEEAVTQEALDSAADIEVERDVFEEISERINDGIDSIKHTHKKLSALHKEISDPRNQAAVSFIMEQTIILLKRIAPELYEADMDFGFDEPHLTGELTGALAMCPALYGRKVSLRPDFTSDKIYASGMAKLRGNVRMSMSGWYLAKIIMNKDCRRLYRKVKRMRAKNS